jgi:hypothetical protein
VKEPDGLNFFVPGSPSRSQNRTEIERLAFLKIDYANVKIFGLGTKVSSRGLVVKAEDS